MVYPNQPPISDPCPAGTKKFGNEQECSSCGPNGVSSTAGSAACGGCGYGSVPNSDFSACGKKCYVKVIVMIWKSLYVIWINLPLRGEIKAFWTVCKRPYGTRYYAKLIRPLQTFRWIRHRKDSRHTAASKHCYSFPLFAPSTHSRFTVLFGAFASCSSLRFSVAFFTVKKTGIYSNSAK